MVGAGRRVAKTVLHQSSDIHLFWEPPCEHAGLLVSGGRRSAGLGHEEMGRGCVCVLAYRCKRFSNGLCEDLCLPGILLMYFLLSVREKDADLRVTSGQFVHKRPLSVHRLVDLSLLPSRIK